MKHCGTPAPPTESALHDSLALQFHDWNGMRPNHSRKTFAEAVRWKEAMLAMCPARKRSAKWDSERRCDVGFVL